MNRASRASGDQSLEAGVAGRNRMRSGKLRARLCHGRAHHARAGRFLAAQSPPVEITLELPEGVDAATARLACGEALAAALAEVRGAAR